MPSWPEKRAAKIEDAEFLIRSGETREAVAARVGCRNVNSLRKLLERASRLDLWYSASPVWEVDPQELAKQLRIIKDGRAKYCGGE